MDVRMKRVYEPAERSDGYRILIDRLWPVGSHTTVRSSMRGRGISLRRQRPRLSELRRRARHGTVTLVFAAKDTEHNDAVVLGEVIRRGLPRAPTGRPS
jgi:uncharacterized protein YeaO (DUF488 family)